MSPEIMLFILLALLIAGHFWYLHQKGTRPSEIAQILAQCDESKRVEVRNHNKTLARLIAICSPQQGTFNMHLEQMEAGTGGVETHVPEHFDLEGAEAGNGSIKDPRKDYQLRRLQKENQELRDGAQRILAAAEGDDFEE